MCLRQPVVSAIILNVALTLLLRSKEQLVYVVEGGASALCMAFTEHHCPVQSFCIQKVSLLLKERFDLLQNASQLKLV